jgi:predicted XRE-type DNA-binding protein
MKFPRKSEIKRVLKRLDRVEPSFVLSPEASTSDRLKYDLCKQFVTFKREHGLTQCEMAKRLGIDEPRLSKLLHYRLDLFTSDKLIDLLIKIHPNLKIQLR